MSSDVQSVVQLQFLSDTTSLAQVIVVLYDYILMFPKEVEYIWNKPWTWISVLYLIVRYIGTYCAIILSFFGSTFMPGTVNVSAGFGYSRDLAYALFECAASFLMVLRVYVMWNRSKVVFVILLLCYTVQAVRVLIWAGLFENPYVDATVGTAQVLNYSVCTEVYSVIFPYEKYSIACLILFDVLLLVLALIPLVKQSMAMYKATRCWEPNRYMSLIVREGVAYIFLTLLRNIPEAIVNFDYVLVPIWSFIFGFLYVIVIFPIFPRFVISMRELFDKDSRGRLGGIDSAFAIRSTHAEEVTAISAIAFVDGSGHPGEEGEEEIQLEAARGGCSA